MRACASATQSNFFLYVTTGKQHIRMIFFCQIFQERVTKQPFRSDCPKLWLTEISTIQTFYIQCKE